ncbi:MAG: AAA family ATPase [Clostridia bacterium]|nr:AAA family ATPase [Clostridia bacterium]
MRLTKIKIHNFRCFGDGEEVIPIDDITSFIGSNSTGKTAALYALNVLFSQNSAERVLRRSDFHLPKTKTPEELEQQEMYIETVFVFDELQSATTSAVNSVPPFFQSLVVDGPKGALYLRIRLEARWEKSNTVEGAIDSKIYYVTCPEGENITEEKKVAAKRCDLDLIRVIYIPAIRDPSKQLKNVSGTMMYQIMSSINWSEDTKTGIKEKIDELNKHFMSESGVSILGSSINSQWTAYDSDSRYSNAQLRFNSTDIESSIRKSEVVFLPTVTGKEYSIDEMGDGLRSLFYISLVDSILDVEVKIRLELEADPEHTSFNRRPPILTVIALEEPENHIAPHLIGKLIINLRNIAQKCNAQTILTSHSPSIIRRVEPENLRYFRMKTETCTTKVRKITLPDSEKLADQYKYVKEAVKAYPELYFAKLVILGEGDSEEIILPKFWEAKNGGTDLSGISFVPLGGRHVNHFWRLLDDLKIPHITLLDLDREREGGGWGRIKYVLNQLIANGIDRNVLLSSNHGVLTEQQLSEMDKWNLQPEEILQSWIQLLESYNVYFSAPLDVDFLMLENYVEYYKGILEGNEGPAIIVNDGGVKHRKLIKNIESGTPVPEYGQRVNDSVKATLKDCGGDGSTYSDEQRKLMVWYAYFFLQRGKPTTHISAMVKIPKDYLLENMPSVFKRLIIKAERMLRGESDEVHTA